ncbi:GPW/gp25 family protein [Marimonas sp. MJW-29]|uniref:GPW/gp25 family protein n=1 Tax=Sulfitobacter sediminis TaxID=3234186 RepID=A0ABV3RNM2_9RHOB
MTRAHTYTTDFPYRFASDGMTARTGYEDHIRDLIEQLLFTRQGERLLHPALGCGLSDLLFGPLSNEVAAAARATIEVAFQEFLAAQVELLALDVRTQDSTLLIDIGYRLVRTGEEGRMSLTAETETGP